MTRAIALFILLTTPLGLNILSAQEFRSTLTGTVADQSGATVGHASVAAVNPETQQSFRSETTDSGTYFIPYIPPGTYTVTVTANGFRTQEQKNVVLDASTERGLNFVLEIGSTSQAMTVSDTPPLLDTASGSGGTVLTGEEVNAAPLNGRQVYMLLGTTPGSQFTVTTFGPGANSGTRGWDVTNAYRLGGGVQGYQQFTLNGANITLQNNGKQGTWEIAPNADALQEANVMTTTYDARYGRTGGGTVNMVIKSGTNAIHGTLYDYLENGALNANNFENNLNNQPRQNTHQQQFGGTIGAPIIKNKLFVFGSYEGYREVIPFTTLTNVPTANLRSLTGGADFSGSGYTIFDPSTTACSSPGGSLGNCAGNKYTRQAFANNTIPVSRISPIGAALLNYYPAPNAGTGWTNNYIANSPDKYHYDQPITRVDYDSSDKTRWNALFAFQHGEEQRNNNGFPGVAEAGAVEHWRQSLTASLDMTHIFTPTLLGDFKLSFTRFLDIENTGNFGAAVDPATIGLNMPQIPTTTLKDLPALTFSQLYTQEISNQVSNNVYNSLTADSEITKTWRNHTFHLGGEFAEFQYANPLSVGTADGAFEFGTTNTQYNPLTRNALSGVLDGNPLADLLLGDPLSGSVAWNHTEFQSYPVFSVFTQDDWKVTPRLTLNIGLRYDVEFGITERYNQLNSGLCTACVNPLTSQINYTAANAALSPYNVSLANPITGGLQFAGVNGQSRSPYRTDWGNIGPRIGFAYSLNPKTVIRGGWGLFYTVGGQLGASNGFSINTPYVASNNGGVTPLNSFASGNPFPGGAQMPPGSSQGLLTALGSTLSLDSPDRRIPRAQIVSFGFQRELPDSFVLDAHYSGNFTSRLPVSAAFNGTMSLAQLQQGIANPNLFTQQVPNPYYGLPGVPATSTLGSNKTINRYLLLLPLSQYGGKVTDTNDPVGTADYNALEVKLSRRFYGQTRGLNLQLAYTYSKTMQSMDFENTFPYQDTFLQHEIAPTDRTHVLSVTGVWNLPVGKGSKYVAPDAKGVLGALINDWTLSWVFSDQTGFPVALNTGYNYGCSQSWTPAGGPTRAQWIYNGNGNPSSCWTTVPQFGLQTLPQQISTLRQPSIPNLDLSLQKNIRITEGTRLQFRAEAFNLGNTPLFPAPDTNPADKLAISNGNPTGFGTVAPTQTNFPRTLQFSLKFLF
jgi:Carboxypeptidase regulatory-like domain